MVEHRLMCCTSSDVADLVKSSLRSGVTLRLSAPGRSMLPCIGDGDVIQVAPCSFEELRVGDIVLVERPDQSLVAHRLIQKRQHGNPKYVQTMGDNVQSPDPLIEPERVLGRVVAVEHGGRATSLSGQLVRLQGVLRTKGRWHIKRTGALLIRRGRFLWSRLFEGWNRLKG